MDPVGLETIEDWYQRYGSSVLLRCRQLLGQEAQAWDAMHQTFVRAIRYRHKYQGTGTPLGWLHSIAWRVCLDELRRRKRQACPGAELPREPGAVSTGDPESAVVAQRTVAWLMPRFREQIQQMVYLRYFDELEIDEIAQQMGVSVRTVERRLGHFLEKSRRLLGQEDSHGIA
ncbi:MAG: RNA polymerase sigma factor [Deltaproteobacteria bacterium]|nr:RNA polymerase sigma factor [Deltaproteobacteria bacterium]